MTQSPLHRLSECGQAVWLDYLSRELVQSGGLAELMSRDAVVGVTSNPTIFDKAIGAGSAYDEQLRQLSARNQDPKEVFLGLAVRDIQAACDVLRPVYERGGDTSPAAGRGGHHGHRDGFVSMEVDPNFAYDTEATIEEAHRLNALIDRPNLFVKIPATRAGLPAIEEMTAAGRSINVTLIFSVERYAAVAEAYIRGLERLVAAGGDPAQLTSVASFFVSRVDTETDRRLDGIGGQEALKGKLAVANAKLAYERYKAIFSGERWEFLESKGATTQRCLWASTSTKNPAYSDIMYVEQLVGPETVNTMPEKTIKAFQDHGKPHQALEENVEEAHDVLKRVAAAGISYADVTVTLEREGVESFVKSFASLFDNIRSRVAAA